MRGTRQSIIVISVLALTLWLAGLTGPAGARAVTALVMGGTGQPYPEQVNGYVDAVGRLYLDPGSSCKVSTCTLMPTYIPNEASPIYTDGMVFGDSVEVGVVLLDAAVRALLTQPEQIVLFGNSQSATVVTEEIRALSTDTGIDLSRLEAVLIGDPNRPNGGFLQRFYPLTVPVFEYTPSAAPLNLIPVYTTNIAFQYDIAADFTRYPLNLFALLNNIIGIDIHGTYTSTHAGYTEDELLAAINDPANSEVVGNTKYITIPAKELPLAEALRDVGYTTGLSAVMNPLADLLEPVLWVLVELGYDRASSYGTQHSFGLFPLVNPVKVLQDLGSAIGEGIQNALAGLAGSGPPADVTAATAGVEPDHPAIGAAPQTAPTSTTPAAAVSADQDRRDEADDSEHAVTDTAPEPVALAGPDADDTATAARDDQRVRVALERADSDEPAQLTPAAGRREHTPAAAQRRPTSTNATHPRFSRDKTRHSAAAGRPGHTSATAQRRPTSTNATHPRFSRDKTRHSAEGD